MNYWITYLLVAYSTTYVLLKYGNATRSHETEAIIAVIFWIICPIYFWALVPYEIILSIGKNFTPKEKT